MYGELEINKNIFLEARTIPIFNFCSKNIMFRGTL